MCVLGQPERVEPALLGQAAHPAGAVVSSVRKIKDRSASGFDPTGAEPASRLGMVTQTEPPATTVPWGRWPTAIVPRHTVHALVDARHGAIAGVCHPHRAAADGDRGGGVANGDGLAGRAHPDVDPGNGVVALLGHPYRVVRRGDGHGVAPAGSAPLTRPVLASMRRTTSWPESTAQTNPEPTAVAIEGSHGHDDWRRYATFTLR